MKQVTIDGPNDVRFIDIPKPAPGPNDVVVKVAACGICGSDLSYVAMGGLPLPTGGPMPIGHELSGVIAAAGATVKRVRVGQRVVVNPEAAGNRIGNGGPEGGFTPYLLVRNVAEADCVYPLPDSLTFQQGALVEPLAVAMHAVNQCAARADDKVVVFGAGPIGLGVIACLRYRGVRDIVAVDLSDTRLAIARQLGAGAVCNAAHGDPWEVILTRHGRELVHGVMPAVGTDVYIDASGAAPVVREIFDHAKFGARMVVVAMHKQEVALPFFHVMAKELTIKGAMAYPTEFPAVIEMLASGAVEVSPMITHQFDFADFNDALAAAQKPEVAAKVMVNFLE
ncbi:MAG: zinc-binding dehydrogenase [Deltaproteobacteria bacterium]|nr:zinc-binding dehydrogenase [Deltaproteobacteria bacterium]